DVLTFFQVRNDRVGVFILVSGFVGWPGNDQRRSRLVDQNRINLVDDREVMTTLHTRGEVKLHIVAQVIKAKLVIGAVSDISGVRGLALEVVHVVLNTTDFKTEEAMDLAHPLGVARSEIVVNRNDVNTTTTRQRIQVRGQSGDKSLALARAHLGDLALVEHDAADHLHVEVTHAGRAHACFSYERESLGQDFVELGALTSLSLFFISHVRDGFLQALFKLSGTSTQLVVGKRLH